MAAGEQRNNLVGALALLLLAGGLYWLASDEHAGGRADRAAAARERCISDGRAAFRARQGGGEMRREQAADLVGRCFSVARQAD
jgi:hypothetical protein